MVLRPRWTQRHPRAVQHLLRSLTQDAGGIVLDVFGVVAVDKPTAFAGEFGQHLAVHDGVWRGSRMERDVGRRCPRGNRPATLEATPRRSVRVTRSRARPVTPTLPERPMFARPPPTPKGRRRREARPIGGGSVGHPCGGSVPPAYQVRSTRFSGAPRPCGPPTQSRPRPSRSDGRCRDACHRFCSLPYPKDAPDAGMFFCQNCPEPVDRTLLISFPPGSRVALGAAPARRNYRPVHRFCT